MTTIRLSDETKEKLAAQKHLLKMHSDDEVVQYALERLRTPEGLIQDRLRGIQEVLITGGAKPDDAIELSSKLYCLLVQVHKDHEVIGQVLPKLAEIINSDLNNSKDK